MDRGADDRIMQIVWSNEDNAYVVTVPAFPGCVTHGSTYEEAQARGHEAIESWIEACKAWGDAISEDEERAWNAFFNDPSVQAKLDRLEKEATRQYEAGEYAEGGFAVEGDNE